MDHSKAQKSKTHKRIISIASKRFREKGLVRVGIAELMKEAGLTCGQFLSHDHDGCLENQTELDAGGGK
jgi:TetR/AcrR family transcriptional regulator, transcriptional repressor for nem operon